MAGLGFGSGRGGAGRGFRTGRGGGGGPEKKGMGIQFVKSSDTFHTGPSLAADTSAKNEMPSFGSSTAGIPNSNSNSGNPPPLLPTPSQAVSQNKSQATQNSNMYATSSFQHSRNAGKSGGSGGSFRFGQSFVKSGDSYSSTGIHLGGPGRACDYRMPGSVNLSKGAPKPSGNSYARIPEAKPVVTKEEYHSAWKKEKDPLLEKFRKLAYEVVALKSDRPNAKDKLHSAANRVPIRIEFNTEPVFGPKNNNSFLCYVFIESVTVASGQGVKIKDSKTNAYEAALQKVLMPHLRIVQVDPDTRELQGSKEPFTSPPPAPSKVPLTKSSAKLAPSASGTAQNTANSKEVASQHKESNMEAACLKRRLDEYKPLEDFVIVEPLVPIPDCTSAHTLRRSADFNHMLLEYEYFFRGEAARCILKIENQVLADVNGVSKVAAKNMAAAQALRKLKKICWVIKTKKAVDSDTKISKDEMLNELNDQSDVISHDNIGNKLLRKMGWSGGGVGKDGSGIAEPVMLKSVLNREGLGLDATKGITDEFRKRVREVIENYASSENQEDLVFASDFRLDERQIIHDECRRLNLRSKSRGKGQQRYLCVRRKRSANQLFDHLMSCGGETARYVLMPPGSDVNAPQLPSLSAGASSAGGMPSGQNGSLGTAMSDQASSNVTVNGPKPLMGAVTKLGKAQSQSQVGILGKAPNMQVNGFSPGAQNMGGGGQQNFGMSGMANSHSNSNQLDQNMGSQWAVPQNMGNSQGIVNGGGIGMQNMGKQNMGMQNGPRMGMQNMGNQNMQNMPHQNMGMQNMGNQNTGMPNIGNQSMGMQNYMGSQNMGMQTMMSQKTGMQNMGNPNMGMQNGQQMRMQNMAMQNMGNQIGMGNQMEMQNTRNQMGMQNMGNQMGMQNMANQMGMQNMANQMGMQNMGSQMGMQNMENQMGMQNMANQMGMQNMANQMGMQNMGSQMGMQNMENQMGAQNMKNQGEMQNMGNPGSSKHAQWGGPAANWSGQGNMGNSWNMQGNMGNQWGMQRMGNFQNHGMQNGGMSSNDMNFQQMNQLEGNQSQMGSNR